MRKSGNIDNVNGTVIANEQATSRIRVLKEGDKIFSGDKIETAENASVKISIDDKEYNLSNGEKARVLAKPPVNEDFNPQEVLDLILQTDAGRVEQYRLRAAKFESHRRYSNVEAQSDEYIDLNGDGVPDITELKVANLNNQGRILEAKVEHNGKESNIYIKEDEILPQDIKLDHEPSIDLSLMKKVEVYKFDKNNEVVFVRKEPEKVKETPPEKEITPPPVIEKEKEPPTPEPKPMPPKENNNPVLTPEPPTSDEPKEPVLIKVANKEEAKEVYNPEGSDFKEVSIEHISENKTFVDVLSALPVITNYKTLDTSVDVVIFSEPFSAFKIFDDKGKYVIGGNFNKYGYASFRTDKLRPASEIEVEAENIYGAKAKTKEFIEPIRILDFSFKELEAIVYDTDEVPDLIVDKLKVKGKIAPFVEVEIYNKDNQLVDTIKADENGRFEASLDTSLVGQHEGVAFKTVIAGREVKGEALTNGLILLHPENFNPEALDNSKLSYDTIRFKSGVLNYDVSKIEVRGEWYKNAEITRSVLAGTGPINKELYIYSDDMNYIGKTNINNAGYFEADFLKMANFKGKSLVVASLEENGEMSYVKAPITHELTDIGVYVNKDKIKAVINNNFIQIISDDEAVEPGVRLQLGKMVDGEFVPYPNQKNIFSNNTTKIGTSVEFSNALDLDEIKSDTIVRVVQDDRNFTKTFNLNELELDEFVLDGLELHFTNKDDGEIRIESVSFKNLKIKENTVISLNNIYADKYGREQSITLRFKNNYDGKNIKLDSSEFNEGRLSVEDTNFFTKFDREADYANSPYTNTSNVGFNIERYPNIDEAIPKSKLSFSENPTIIFEDRYADSPDIREFWGVDNDVDGTWDGGSITLKGEPESDIDIIQEGSVIKSFKTDKFGAATEDMSGYAIDTSKPIIAKITDKAGNIGEHEIELKKAQLIGGANDDLKSFESGVYYQRTYYLDNDRVNDGFLLFLKKEDFLADEGVRVTLNGEDITSSLVYKGSYNYIDGNRKRYNTDVNYYTITDKKLLAKLKIGDEFVIEAKDFSGTNTKTITSTLNKDNYALLLGTPGSLLRLEHIDYFYDNLTKNIGSQRFKEFHFIRGDYELKFKLFKDNPDFRNADGTRYKSFKEALFERISPADLNDAELENSHLSRLYEVNFNNDTNELIVKGHSSYIPYFTNKTDWIGNSWADRILHLSINKAINNEGTGKEVKNPLVDTIIRNVLSVELDMPNVPKDKNLVFNIDRVYVDDEVTSDAEPVAKFYVKVEHTGIVLTLKDGETGEILDSITSTGVDDVLSTNKVDLAKEYKIVASDPDNPLKTNTLTKIIKDPSHSMYDDTYNLISTDKGEIYYGALMKSYVIDYKGLANYLLNLQNDNVTNRVFYPGQEKHNFLNVSPNSSFSNDNPDYFTNTEIEKIKVFINGKEVIKGDDINFLDEVLDHNNITNRDYLLVETMYYSPNINHRLYTNTEDIKKLDFDYVLCIRDYYNILNIGYYDLTLAQFLFSPLELYNVKLKHDSGETLSIKEKYLYSIAKEVDFSSYLAHVEEFKNLQTDTLKLSNEMNIDLSNSMSMLGHNNIQKDIVINKKDDLALNIVGENSEARAVETGEGNDIINFYAKSPVMIHTNEGNDIVNINTQITDKFAVNTGDGDDVILINIDNMNKDFKSFYVVGGDGIDILKLKNDDTEITHPRRGSSKSNFMLEEVEVVDMANDDKAQTTRINAESLYSYVYNTKELSIKGGDNDSLMFDMYNNNHMFDFFEDFFRSTNSSEIKPADTEGEYNVYELGENREFKLKVGKNLNFGVNVLNYDDTILETHYIQHIN